MDANEATYKPRPNLWIAVIVTAMLICIPAALGSCIWITYAMDEANARAQEEVKK